MTSSSLTMSGWPSGCRGRLVSSRSRDWIRWLASLCVHPYKTTNRIEFFLKKRVQLNSSPTAFPNTWSRTCASLCGPSSNRTAELCNIFLWRRTSVWINSGGQPYPSTSAHWWTLLTKNCSRYERLCITRTCEPSDNMNCQLPQHFRTFGVQLRSGHVGTLLFIFAVRLLNDLFQTASQLQWRHLFISCVYEYHFHNFMYNLPLQ